MKMSAEKLKCVILVNETLPIGIAANTAAILGITLGMKMPGVVGCDVYDADGYPHMGIIQFPIPVLKASTDALKKCRETLYAAQYAALTVVDFSNLAQGCKTYPEYIEKMAETAACDLHYIGIAICGNQKQINSLTGTMPLLR